MPLKPCNRCGKDIGFRKEDGRVIPLNPDGTLHRCQSQTTAPTNGHTETITGRLDGYNTGSATFTVKGGFSKTYAIVPSLQREWQALGYSKEPEVWLEFGLDKNKFVQGSKQVPKPAWATDLPAQQPIIESPTAAPTSTAPEKSTENCTSSVDAPASMAPAYNVSKIREITIGGTINLQNFENVKIEVTGTDPEEIRKCLLFTAATLGGGHGPTRELIAGYIKRVLSNGRVN